MKSGFTKTKKKTVGWEQWDTQMSALPSITHSSIQFVYKKPIPLTVYDNWTEWPSAFKQEVQSGSKKPE